MPRHSAAAHIFAVRHRRRNIRSIATWPRCQYEASKRHRCRPTSVSVACQTSPATAVETICIVIDRIRIPSGIEARFGIATSTDHHLIEAIVEAILFLKVVELFQLLLRCHDEVLAIVNFQNSAVNIISSPLMLIAAIRSIIRHYNGLLVEHDRVHPRVHP